MKKKSKTKYVAALAVIVIVSGALMFIYGDELRGLFGEKNEFIKVGLYDKTGHPIQQSLIPFSLVTEPGGEQTQGVAYMDFTVSVENTGELPLTVSIHEASPSQLDSAFTTSTQTILSGETAAWGSSLIPTEQFDGSSQTFYAKVKGVYTYAGEIHELYKEGQVTYAFDADPLAGMEMNFESSLGNSDGGVDPPDDPDDPDDPPLLKPGTSCTTNEECQSGNCGFGTITMNSFNVQNKWWICCSSPCSSCPGTEAPSVQWGNVCGPSTTGKLYEPGISTSLTCTSNIKTCA